MTEDANGNEADKEGLPDFVHSIKQQKLSSGHWKREDLQRCGLTKDRYYRVINQEKMHNQKQLIQKSCVGCQAPSCAQGVLGDKASQGITGYPTGKFSECMKPQLTGDRTAAACAVSALSPQHHQMNDTTARRKFWLSFGLHSKDSRMYSAKLKYSWFCETICKRKQKCNYPLLAKCSVFKYMDRNEVPN